MNWIIGTALVIAIITIVFALYCALIVAGRSDDQAEMKNNEGDDDMFFRKQICPRCKTGKYTYDLDPKSEACPYIGCWKKNKCHFYKPLDKEPKKGIFSGFKNKRSVTPPPRKIALRWAFGGFSEVNKIRSIS